MCDCAPGKLGSVGWRMHGCVDVVVVMMDVVFVIVVLVEVVYSDCCASAFD